MTGVVRRRSLLVSALLCWAATLGCNVFPLIAPNGPTTPERENIQGAPGKFSYRVSQFVFLSDFEVQKNLPIFRDLAAMRDQVYKELELPPSNTIVQVFLFEDKERYERFMQLKHPDLPKRRAFFVAQPRRLGGNEDLLVYTYWGDRIQQDLRHELTHALLHCVLKDVPLWLDEGLAEFFEVPPGWNGVNAQHVEQLRGRNKFDLDRLEQLSDVQQMNPAEYREAWAWTHLMLRSTPPARQALVSYLQELRTNPHPGALRPRLEKVFLSVDPALERHLASLSKTRPN
jgi:Protein of unknown function (DUF1570)